MANQQWTDPGVLEAHLQQAIALELWTIPLYLTASASI